MSANPRPGRFGFRVSASGNAGLDWPNLDALWATAAEHDVFDAFWLSDHLSDATRVRNGPAFEAFTTAAALAHRVAGKWIGIAVAANTFRHPALLAKEATQLDIVTGGRFILGIGAGWHVGEHAAFGVDLPAPRERFDRYEAAVEIVRALFSDAARQPPGVTLEAGPYRLDAATNEPGPLSPTGPPIWLGGLRRRGVSLIARYASGWPLPGTHAGDVAYFVTKRDEIRGALEAAGRDPGDFTFAAQLNAGSDASSRRQARGVAQEMLSAGANHVILGLPGTATPDSVRELATQVAEPLRDFTA